MESERRKRILVFAGFSVDTWSSIEQRYVWLEEIASASFDLCWLVHPPGSRNAVVRNERNRENIAAYVKRLKGRGATLIECEIDRRNLLGNYIRLRRLFRRHDIDAVYTHFSPLRYHVEAAARLSGVRVIRGEHNFTFHPTRRYRWLKKAFWKWSTDFYIPVSEAVAEHLVEHVASPERVYAVPNGFDFAERPDESPAKSRERIAAELGVPDAHDILPCAARIHPSKQQHLLVEVMEECGPDTVLLLAGNDEDDDYARDLRRKVQERGLQERVRFLGYRDDVLQLMNAATVTLLLSRFEGLPNAVVESMSVGTPVIGSDIPSIREIISDGENGLLVDASDVSTIAGLVRMLMVRPQRRSSMGQKAKEAVVSRFGKDAFLHNTRIALEHAVAGSQAARP